MLNISPKSVTKMVSRRNLSSLRYVESKKSGKVFIKILIGLSILLFLTLLLPWTQNIQAPGTVTTVRPDQRPQTIHSIIAGRIEKWYVQEGDFVEKGDTILFISEVKDAYFDPELLPRTEKQLGSKQEGVKAYNEKVKALTAQIAALKETSKLKLEQTENKLRQAELKIATDSIDLEAAHINANIAEEQLKRMEQLQQEGLKSLTDLESRRLKAQKAKAKLISAENKLLTTRNELLNVQVEIVSLETQYRNAIAKAESDKYTAMSNMYDAEITVNKMENQLKNYSVRAGYYYITAPQSGYVTQAIQSGIGETIKEGSEIVSIMPSEYDLAVAMYVEPIDLPLIEKGQKVRLQFDGWPAIVFSGWPNTSYGTFGGKVFAIDNFISTNGKFRLLVAPDPEAEPWPEALRVGGGARNMLLLKDVMIWYELWRRFNGFPPDYYKAASPQKPTEK
ncbi:HlyD family secretion protein [Owenweeksia hongkongensis]|uniref:HlyD family secretion protein n=1 Tax=Owenweeksia hongkongensis TaxID=253245 RepID=UPI003A921D7A